MTKYPDIFAALAYPFEDSEVKVLPKAGGQKYITARTAMNRLDSVLGPENWRDEYEWLPNRDAILCRLSIRLPEGIWLTKVDAGARSKTGDDGVDDMGAASDALKRAGVKFGIGRYLYKDGVPPFVLEPDEAKRRGILIHSVGISRSDVRSALAHLGATCEQIHGATYASCQEQADHLGPAGAGRVAVADPPPPAAPSSTAPSPIPLGRQPNTGKQLLGWMGGKERETGLDLMGMLMDWAKGEGHPLKVAEWPVGLVSDGFARLAAELDRRGLVLIPPEARAQMAIQAGPRKGPLTIDPKDPFREQKLAIKELAKKLASAFLGTQTALTEEVVMAYIQARQAAHRMTPISSLRECSVKKVIDDLMEALREDERDVQVVS